MVSYSALSNNYSFSAPKGFRQFMRKHGIFHANTCAVRLAYALFLSDKSFFGDVTVSSGVEWYGLPTRADDLAKVLNNKVGKARLTHSLNTLKDKKGIVFFDTIVGFEGTGHISLWDGAEVVDGGDYSKNSPRAYFWELV